MTSESDYKDGSLTGDMLQVVETAVGVVAAQIYKSFIASGMTPPQALNAIQTHPAWVGASRVFGPIGAAAAGLSAVHEAVNNGGSVDDFLEAAENVLIGFAGAAIGASIAAAALGVAPVSITAMVVGMIAGFLAQKIADDVIEPLLEALVRLFNPPPIDPVILDLDGDGVELTALAGSNAYFDLDGDGFAERTGWVKSDDGRCCCRTLRVEDSQCESMRLDGLHEQAITRPLPYDELVQLHCVAMQTRISADLAGQGHDLARAA